MAASGWTRVGVVVATPVIAALATLAVILGVSAPAAARLNDAVPAEFRGFIEQAAEACPGLPAQVLAAQLQQESGFNPAAVSPAGAMGIAQFMPGAPWCSRRSQPAPC